MKIKVIDEVVEEMPFGWSLHCQFCEFDGEPGYRFMWSFEGKLKPYRGGARIPEGMGIPMLYELERKMQSMPYHLRHSDS